MNEESKKNDEFDERIDTKRQELSDPPKAKGETNTLSELNTSKPMCSGASTRPDYKSLGKLTNTIEVVFYTGHCAEVKNRGRSGCSKHCSANTKNTRYTMTVCTSQENRKKSKKKPISYKIKKTLVYVRRKTGQSVRGVKKFCKNLGPRKAYGFECNLKKCRSSLVDCYNRPCKKPDFHVVSTSTKQTNTERTSISVCENTRPTVCQNKPIPASESKSCSRNRPKIRNTECTMTDT